MNDTRYTPEFVLFLEDVKALFSTKLSNMQQDHYQSLLLWIKKVRLFDQQTLSYSFTDELKYELLELLRPVQNALTAPCVIELDKEANLAKVIKKVTDFYLAFDPLPGSEKASVILSSWQSKYGHGSIPPVLPMPEPMPHHPNKGNTSHSIFTPNKDIPWTKADTTTCDDFNL